jgi:hypothetical protein
VQVTARAVAAHALQACHSMLSTPCCTGGGCVVAVGGSRAACQQCPGVMMTSRPGAPSVAFCQCLAGYGAYGSKAGSSDSCTMCPLGTYSPGPPKQPLSLDEARAAATQAAAMKATIPACIPCNSSNPAGSFTTLAPGSSSAEQCVCRAGHGGTLCSACAPVRVPRTGMHAAVAGFTFRKDGAV